MKFYQLYIMDMFGKVADGGIFTLLKSAVLNGEKWKKKATGNVYEVVPFEEKEI